MLCFENNLAFLIHISDEKFENCIDLLIITDKTKSHYVYIKDFNIFVCNKAKWKAKERFYKYCLQCFSGGKYFIEHTETYLEINVK